MYSRVMKSPPSVLCPSSCKTLPLSTGRPISALLLAVVVLIVNEALVLQRDTSLILRNRAELKLLSISVFVPYLIFQLHLIIPG